MVPLPDWLEALTVRQPDESGGEHIARVIRDLNGVSLDTNPKKLAEFFQINEPSVGQARAVSTIKTNCATSMRCTWAVAGCVHAKAVQPYVTQMAIAWVLEIARDMNALIHLKEYPDAWTHLEPGWGMYYEAIGDPNNNHVETCLGVPDFHTGVCLRGGGGRAGNLISIKGPDDIRKNNGRPLKSIIRPDRLFP